MSDVRSGTSQQVFPPAKALRGIGNRVQLDSAGEFARRVGIRRGAGMCTIHNDHLYPRVYTEWQGHLLVRRYSPIPATKGP